MVVNNKVNIVVKAIDKATKPLKGIAKGFSGLNKSLKKNKDLYKGMAVGGTAAFTAVGFGIKKLVDQASDLEEITQKFDVVYSDLGNSAKDAAKDIAKGYGLSKRASKQFLADLGDVTSGFGLSQEASLDYATDVVKLGADLASFGNIAGGTEEAVDRLNKGFLGEHENLKALGIIINDTMLKKQLLADGTSELTGLELEQAKIQARMTIAYSQSANAIGDVERSKGSLANQTRFLQSAFEDVTTELGQAFLPIITEITTALVPIIKDFAEWAKENKELVKILGIAAIAITGIITVLGVLGLVIPVIVTGVSALGTALMFLAANPIGLVITAIAAGITIGILLVKNWDTIIVWAKKLGNWLVELYDKWGFLLGPIYLVIEAGKLLITHWDDIKAAVVSLGEGILSIWDSVATGTDRVWESIVSSATKGLDTIKSALKKAKDIAIEIATLGFADTQSFNGNNSGGSVDGARALGGTVMAGKTYKVGENGEELFTPSTTGKITSNGSTGGVGGVNINIGDIIVQNEADENRLIEKIEESLTRTLQLQKMGIS